MSELRNAKADRWDFDRTVRLLGIEHPFERGITFADLDIEIECNGQFLAIEGQREDYALTKGQRLSATARVATGRTVLVVYGRPPSANDRSDPGEITAIRVWPAEAEPCDWQRFFDICKAWFAWANAQQRPECRPNAFVVGMYEERELPHCVTHGMTDLWFDSRDGSTRCRSHSSPWPAVAA